MLKIIFQEIYRFLLHWINFSLSTTHFIEDLPDRDMIAFRCIYRPLGLLPSHLDISYFSDWFTSPFKYNFHTISPPKLNARASADFRDIQHCLLISSSHASQEIFASRWLRALLRLRASMPMSRHSEISPPRLLFTASQLSNFCLH